MKLEKILILNKYNYENLFHSVHHHKAKNRIQIYDVIEYEASLKIKPTTADEVKHLQK